MVASVHHPLSASIRKRVGDFPVLVEMGTPETASYCLPHAQAADLDVVKTKEQSDIRLLLIIFRFIAAAVPKIP